MDDPFIPCPYNKIHRVPRSRIQRHIIKCPDKRPDFTVCPFNATHIIPALDFSNHTEDCPSKPPSFPENNPPTVIAAIEHPRPYLQRHYLPETDPNHEIWND